MNRFNEYMNTHFKSGGCRLIARAYDKCRERAVELYAMPGYWDAVGVTDGTDAWIAPASAGLFFGTATGDCAELMRRLEAGEDLPPVAAPTAPRKRVRLEEPESLPHPAATAAQPVRRERVRL